VVTDPQVIAERVHRLTVQRLPVPLIEQQVRRRDGQLLDVETMATPVTDGGEPAFHVVMRDISERRRAQQALQAHLAALNEARGALQELNAGLEQRVAGRTAQLEAANAELDSFAYAVSHDLRAPLRALSGFSQALLEDHAERLDGDARLFLNQIILASHRMGALIDGLLSLSRSTRGQMQNGPVDLGELAERAMLELRSAEPARQLNLSLSGNLRVQGDARMLDAVMRNLIGNAWKYTARCALAQVRVSEEWRNGQRWIAVADNGAGFDMAHASRLFQAFTRLHRQDEFPGLGIGLATVQRIIKRHGGVIEMQAEVNRGATIRFHLPDTPATGPES
jgi:signal transduction histidine kinase